MPKSLDEIQDRSDEITDAVETAMTPPESKVKDPKAAFTEAVAKIDLSYLEASLVEATASQGVLPIGLRSWAAIVLPLFQSSNEQSKDLILKLVEKVYQKPDVWTKLLRLFPPTSTELLLQHTFPPPPTPTREEKVALAGVQDRPADIAYIFVFCLRSTGIEGNPYLATEATEIAIWTLTKSIDSWEHWNNIYKENLKTSVALLKKIPEKWEDLSLEPLLPIEFHRRRCWKKISKIKKYFYRKTGTSCERELGRDVRREMEEAVKKATKAVERAMEEEVKIKQVKIVTEMIFKFSLRLAGEGNPDLAKEAT